MHTIEGGVADVWVIDWGGAIAGIVEGHVPAGARLAKRHQVDPQEAVGVHGVSRNLDRPGVWGDADTVAGVEGDDVALARLRASYSVTLRGVNKHAVAPVSDGNGAAGVRADVVAPNLVDRGPGTGDVNAVAVVAGDDVARPGRRPADRVAGRAVDVHAVAGVAQVGGAGDVGADVVALEEIAAVRADLDAVTTEAVDHQTFHRAATGSDVQPVDGARAASV